MRFGLQVEPGRKWCDQAETSITFSQEYQIYKLICAEGCMMILKICYGENLYSFLPLVYACMPACITYTYIFASMFECMHLCMYMYGWMDWLVDGLMDSFADYRIKC